MFHVSGRLFVLLYMSELYLHIILNLYFDQFATDLILDMHALGLELMSVLLVLKFGLS